MAAAPQQGAHLRGVQAAAGADGQLAAPLRQLPDGDGGLHPLNLSQEGGDILHILLSCARLVHEGQGHGGHSDFPALIAVHPLGEQPLHLEPRPALGAEVALVEGEHVDAGVHQGGGHPVGVRCGIAVLKAAGVGGHGHIQGYRHGGGDGAEFPENVVDQLAAGGPPGVQAGLRRKKRLGGVVVDGQINPPRQPGFSSPGEQAAGGDVHAHHRLRNIALRGQAALQIGGEQVGLLVAVGTVVAVINLDGDSASEQETSNESNSSQETTKEKSHNEVPKPGVAVEERWYSPVVIQLARDAKIPKEELDTLQGTGYEGRLSKKDIKDYIDRKKRGLVSEPKPATIGITSTANAPSAIMPAASASPKSSPVPAVQSVASTATPQSSAPINTSGVEMKEMDRVRRIIADHMVMSKKVSPHVTNVLEVDVTKLVRWREKNKDVFFRHEGVKLTYMPMITEAVAKALVTYPQLNVSVDGYNILFKKHINVGIAVSLNDGNLIVPVVHDADHLNLNGLAVAIDSLALKARDNKLMPEDIDGGTFTITNFGTFKSLFGTPIINQPQVAILGVGYIEKKPAVVETPEGDTIAIRHKMYLSLSYDHRVVDGMLGGNFLHFIADYLENWKG